MIINLKKFMFLFIGGLIISKWTIFESFLAKTNMYFYYYILIKILSPLYYLKDNLGTFDVINLKYS